MPRLTRIVLWLYIVFNLAIALVLATSPAQVDAAYQGGAMTPTRRFLWFSIASLHLFVVGATLVSLNMRRAAERRWIHPPQRRLLSLGRRDAVAPLGRVRGGQRR